MKRRDFIRYGMCGLAAVAVGSHIKIPAIFQTQAYAAAAHSFDVSITDALVEMADATPVYHWRFQFADLPDTFPGPVIVANPGDSITLNLTNNLDEPHAFAVMAAGPNPNAFVPGSYSGAIAPGVGPVSLTFTAPAPGTYLYVDPFNGGTTAFGPGNRVLGLHGVLIVLPTSGNNPYGVTSGNVYKLFNDLGNSAHFPGDGWSPNPNNDNHRERLWLFSQVDKTFNDRALNGQTINFDIAKFVSDYYTINGISGAFASHPPHMDDEGFEEHYRNRDVIVPRAFIGQPILIRIINAGVCLHSAHIHGNHVFVTAVNGLVQSNVIFVDTFTIQPPESQYQGSVPAPGASQASPVLTGGSRVDWLLPVICPPDIPGEGLLTVRAAEELALGPADGLLTPASPFEYPMHCHTEMSQTMRGGNYPMGLVTHWEILGDRIGDTLYPFPGVHDH